MTIRNFTCMVSRLVLGLDIPYLVVFALTVITSLSTPFARAVRQQVANSPTGLTVP